MKKILGATTHKAVGLVTRHPGFVHP